MPSEANNRHLFDRWAESYDLGVPASTEFPLAGYGQVLMKLVLLAEAKPGMSVLDLGTGTGNLAGLFLAQHCSVWATDFSPGMIARARTKYPAIRFSIADLRDSFPTSFPGHYDRITSAYALHHKRMSLAGTGTAAIVIGSEWPSTSNAQSWNAGTAIP